MVENNISFTARITFLTKQSYLNSKKYRSYITYLKHNCGNDSVEHFVQWDDSAFILSTAIDHPVKADGISSHQFSYGKCGHYTEKEAFDIFTKHIKRYKELKNEIDMTPDAVAKVEKMNIKNTNWITRVFKYLKRKISNSISFLSFSQD